MATGEREGGIVFLSKEDGALSVPCEIPDFPNFIAYQYRNIAYFSYHFIRDHPFSDFVLRYDDNHKDIAILDYSYEVSRSDVVGFLTDRLNEQQQNSETHYNTWHDQELADAIALVVRERYFTKEYLPLIVLASLHHVRHVRRVKTTVFLPIRL
jgi:hypothetical protein